MLYFVLQTSVSLYGIGEEDNLPEKSKYGSVMSLAQRYVGLIQNMQPRGPYYLGKFNTLAIFDQFGIICTQYAYAMLLLIA